MRRKKQSDATCPMPRLFSRVRFVPVAGSRNYLARVWRLVDCVNRGYFLGHSPGEVRLLGFSARPTKRSLRVVLYFAVSRNINDVRIGRVKGIRKRGWDRLLVGYETREDPRGGLVQLPFTAFAQRVYEAGDFDALGIAK